MTGLITIRMENEDNTTVKVIGADRKTIKMLSFTRAAFSVVKQKYNDDNIYYADYNLNRSVIYVLVSDDGKLNI